MTSHQSSGHKSTEDKDKPQYVSYTMASKSSSVYKKGPEGEFFDSNFVTKEVLDDNGHKYKRSERSFLDENGNKKVEVTEDRGSGNVKKYVLNWEDTLALNEPI